MKRTSTLLAIGLCLVLEAAAADSITQWPAIEPRNKPWTRWWWPGNAVDKPGLTAQLEKFAAAGIGGVEITPIYGAQGYESRYIQYLSPEWMDMLQYTGREAARLGLGVDMATGTGWPFGGPWIDLNHAIQKVVLKDGKLTGEPSLMMVKRAGPGGEGLVVDPFSPAALRRYLAPFDRAFSGFPRGLVRGQFHDSFEYANASWTPDFPDVFAKSHGYDIQPYATALLDPAAPATDTLERVRSDYRETIAALHLDYLHTWVQWSHDHGFIVRNQSHGAPANLLDLYGNADIAETEVFGSTPFPIPGLRRLDDEVRHDQDLPESLVIRMASSAGHVTGHNLSSSETATWLRDHWKVALAYVKPEIDRLFCDGINHIFYQGTVYSPADVPWPGWLFYAATQFNPANPWWDDFHALNEYVGRVQSVLQRGTPDNDVLLYWPVFDLWDATPGMATQLAVHDVKWLTGQPVGALARQLVDRGYSFDYVSDAQLQGARATGGAIDLPGGRYKVLVVPAARRMPVETMEQIARLADSGVSVVFESLPGDVPGLGQLEARRARFQAALDKVKRRAVISPDIPKALDAKGVTREAAVDSGLNFVRRKSAAGHDYFFANLGAQPFDGWITLGAATRSAALLNPLTGEAGLAAVRAGIAGKAQVYMQLAPGESILVRTLATTSPGGGARWTYARPGGDGIPLTGEWDVEFIKGGPTLPAPFKTSALQSWTAQPDPEASRFAGIARYRLTFDRPETGATQWALDLGDVRESARVRLNGEPIATAWSLPFVVPLHDRLKPGRNVLELEVTNLAANRIRDLDLRGVQWKIMREINFVNINYQPFDASKWELKPSGLLGPVRLVPLQNLTP